MTIATPRRALGLAALAAGLALGTPHSAVSADDPLPSWNEGPAKAAILDFVGDVTAAGGPDFVPARDRLAVFDNDGTLWVEQPFYAQAAFAFDRIKRLAPGNPALIESPAIRAVLDNDPAALAATGLRGITEVVMASHAGMTTDEFAAIAGDWLATARHPRFDKSYPQLVYQPMLELLAHLRSAGFATWIVSGGGIDFIRAYAEAAYGIPPEQVIGSTIETRFELREGRPVLARLPELDFLDDKAGKPVAIQKFIGRRPIAAFGNSDGDLEMLQYVTAGPGRRFGAIVRHDDAEREYAYDRQSHVGRLDRALDAAHSTGWTVVSMRADWRSLFPEEQP